MDWTSIAATKVNDLTKTRSAGRPVNSHVVLSRPAPKPDYDLMKKAIHSAPDTAPSKSSERK